MDVERLQGMRRALLAVVVTGGALLAVVFMSGRTRGPAVDPGGEAGGKVRGTPYSQWRDAEPPRERVVRFEGESSVGVLYTRPWPGGERWRKLGPARGKVRIAEAVELKLALDVDAWKDLSFLEAMGPEDLQAIEFVANAFVRGRIPAGQIAKLKHLTGLRSLSLYGTGITNASLAEIETLSGLRELDLSSTPTGDGGLAYLEGMEGLERLGLRHTLVTDDGLEHLEGLAALVELNLANTAITRRGLKELSLALPKCKILHSILPNPAIRTREAEKPVS